ncbi:zinc finger FYVE domain-containing protein 26 [Bifidobacterium animalis subsp. animalis]|uniref:helix-turn-helix domain-containing protein n=1 Tax=Bifidobacterium animalis TaxID=28025 RepID=UPI001021CDF3|nr:helix-turn-helix transcriptional regulator [Bifidobacterium animalis]RYN12656.1 zinc finger FYVE domain-containing protein 26 [Bifidobacterium animalis subsp. animalis]
MSNVNIDFGHKAERIIHDKGMTKRAVSEKSGIPYSSLNSILKGYRAVTLEFIIALAEAVGVLPSELLPEQFVAKALASKEGEAK